MRHGDKINALGRTKSHRDALLKNMACSLIEHKRIFTSLAKAKALRVYLEPMITRSKSNQTHDRRVVFSYLQNKYAVDTLFTEISEKVASRPGGYLRIIKTGPRKSDATEMAMIEFVDYNTIYDPNESAKKAKSTTRRSRRKSKVAEESTASSTSAPATEVVEEPTVEVNAPAEELHSTEEVINDVASSPIEELAADVTETVADTVADPVQEATESAEEVAQAAEESAPEADTTEENTDEQKDA
jgi:large subunit ribosomal protein L17